MEQEIGAQVVALPYSIAGCSEHSGRYVAENIMVNNPLDQSSRWSGAYQTTNARQWVLLRLDSPAVLKSITFGKFHKQHPCNMKEFKLYVGQWEDNMTEVLHAGLKNDSVPETFAIRSVNDAGLTFPTRYIKIEPLSAHGHSFHTSIWFVQLNGINDVQFVARIERKHEEYRESIITSLILKHLRQRRILGPFRDIQSRTGIQLEHPTISALYEGLVLEGNFAHCEILLHSIADLSLFTTSLLATQPFSRWTRLHAVDADGDAPSARGGHAMCMDSQGGKVYLHGGWDGQKNLDDFWVYDVNSEKWTVLGYSTQRSSYGPGPRACHKMSFDSSTGDIYVFGQLFEATSTTLVESAEGAHASGTSAPTVSPVSPSISRALPSTARYSAQLFRYRTRGHESGQWTVLFDDTTAAGGPPVVFDHQMVVDAEARKLYIFGGRVCDGDWEALKYSGFFSYDIRRNIWEGVFSSDGEPIVEYMSSRYGHSMVFDNLTKTLFVFGGQRDEKYLSDMYAYHIPTNTVTELFHNFTAAGGPDACFTQRAVIDPHLREIYVFCGLTRHSPTAPTILNTDAPYWIYRYERPEHPGKWIKMLPAESGSPSNTSVPVARYAHQVVYDPETKVIYMHGGNAQLEADEDGNVLSRDPDLTRGERAEESEAVPETPKDETKDARLDDFWKMSLIRPSSDDIIRRAKFILRQQQFRELCEDSNPLKALAYLQTEVSAVVNHSDPAEAEGFRALLSHLLSPSASKKRTRDESDKLESEDDPMTASSSPVRRPVRLPESGATESPSRTSLLALKEDPIERSVNGGNAVSDARFKQRTEVFEQLMTFVNEDAKQPDKDLMHMINVDHSEIR